MAVRTSEENAREIDILFIATWGNLGVSSLAVEISTPTIHVGRETVEAASLVGAP
jgi:hypothetical protein